MLYVSFSEHKQHESTLLLTRVQSASTRVVDPGHHRSAVMGRRKMSLSDNEYDPANDEDELIGQLRHMFRKPQPSKELTKPVNFIITCGNHKWLVHEEPIIQQSGFFKMMSDSKFRVSTDVAVRLASELTKTA